MPSRLRTRLQRYEALAYAARVRDRRVEYTAKLRALQDAQRRLDAGKAPESVYRHCCMMSRVGIPGDLVEQSAYLFAARLVWDDHITDAAWRRL